MTELKTFTREQIFFNNVKIGDELPPVTKKINLMKIALFSSVVGNWTPIHYDYKSAQDSGYPEPIMPGMQITAYCSQVLTDWILPIGILKNYKCRVIGFTYSHDTLTIRGKVTKKYILDGENYVECDVWAVKQNDTTVVAKASGTVTLPSNSP